KTLPSSRFPPWVVLICCSFSSLPGPHRRPSPLDCCCFAVVGVVLLCRFRQDPSKGKESFARAKEASGLTAGLTGALGKRTKYQQSQIAQLVLVASSA
ncbi:unnamed protein product, partial [Ectocarpus sp. 12 AP-2014]